MSELTLDDLGVPAEATTTIDAGHAARVAAVLDQPAPQGGDRLPTLWHWAWFTPSAASADLGPDGHPRRRSPHLAPYPRRMWGAGEVTWAGDLVVGQPATRTTTLVEVKETSGRSAPLLIVRLAHRYHQGGRLAVQESQAIVYRPPGPPLPAPQGRVVPDVPAGGHQEVRVPDPTLLFRFSAVTFNAHRIHYDLPYARDEEGYPGLVVHGPLTSLLMAAVAERAAGRLLARWSFKATAPLFAGSPVALTAVVDGTRGHVTATRNDGAVAVRAEMDLR